MPSAGYKLVEIKNDSLSVSKKKGTNPAGVPNIPPDHPELYPEYQALGKSGLWDKRFILVRREQTLFHKFLPIYFFF